MRNISTGQDDEQDPWNSAFSLARALYLIRAQFNGDRTELIRRLDEAIKDPIERRSALILLGALDVEYTVELAATLAMIALSHGDALQVRQLFGRLEYNDAVHVVPEAVWRLLDSGDEDDDDAYRRCAELFEHL